MAAQKKKAVAKRKRKPPAKPRGRPTKLTPQNIDRLVPVFRAAKRVSRVLLIDLYTAVVLEATGRDSVPQSDWADVSLYIPHRQRVFIKERGPFDDLRRHEANRVFPETLPGLAERAIMLFRPMAMSDKGVQAVLDGAAFTYSMWEGYLNQKGSRRVLQWLEDHDIPRRSIHTSGHASVADLGRFAAALAPRALIRGSRVTLLSPWRAPIDARCVFSELLITRGDSMRLTSFAIMTAGALLVSGAAAAERGSDGHVNIIYWQAPSILNPYLSGGTKDHEAASMVLEPLARFDESGTLIPWLAASVPTVGNGGVSANFMTITWKLRDGLLWSDGSPVTAADVVFTADYCRDTAGGCSQLAKFDEVTEVKAVDDLTVEVTFGVPKPYPYGPFVGATSPILQKAQFADCTGARAPECSEANFIPIGTGPFRVTEFRSNDFISLEANPHYRDPAKPAFATLTFKGGGDAAAAARAVLETGEFDYAWNLQLVPAPELGNARSTRAHPHPFLSDRAVRKALSMAIDRELLVEVGYGQAARPTCNVVPAPEVYASAANEDCLVQDIEGAKRLLDEAGWRPGPDGVRQEDGIRLSILYQTSTNAVRQDFKALIKQWWSEIGIEVELRDIDASVFFGGDPDSPDTYQKFFADIEMYANNFEGADPEPYLGGWRCGNEPRPASQWRGANVPRYCSEEYDRLLGEMAKTGDLGERARLAKAMNDMLVQDHVLIPLVHRGRVSAHAHSLGGVLLNTWDSELWNIADWHRIR